ncbi:MAG: hypothetical protein H7837_12705 [Magnetococcus sp. MYC-9]
MSGFTPRPLFSTTLALSMLLGSVVAPSWATAAEPAPAAPAAAPAAPAAAPAAPAAAPAAPAAAPAAPVAAPAPAAAPAAAVAVPAVAGSYDVSYTDAVEKKTKEGVVIVSKKGEGFKVDYEDADGKYTGIAFLQGSTLGVAYAENNKASLYLLEPSATGGWKGRYMEAGDSFLSTEEWKRR